LKKIIIKDSIHGSIVLNELEERVLDSCAMQRLRKVKQLALSYLVYPGANNTRFEHCLGTFFLAGRMCEEFGIGGEERQELKLAALLHDVGHGAFSHESELIFREFKKGGHEENALKMMKGEIGGLLEEKGYFKDTVKLFKNHPIICSDVGSDRMDYLVRDARFTGVAYGVIDVDRILKTLVLKEGKLMVDRKGLEAVESLLIARFLMFSSVYYHHAVRIASAMLRKALKMEIELGNLELDDLLKHGDGEILYMTRANPLIKRINERRLYKRAFEININEESHGKGNKFDFKKFERELLETLEKAKIDCSCVIADYPEMMVKPVTISIWDGEEKDLKELSPLVNSLRSRISLLVACDEKQKEKVAKECERFF